MLEITLTTLAKALTPLITTLTKECAGIIKEQRQKWEAKSSTKKLSKIILNINTVKTMWSREKGILINEFYYPSRITSRYSSSPSVEPETLIFTNTIIEGIVGQGKSILMRQLCNSAVENSIIPVFIELRMISSERSLSSLITDFLDAAGIHGGSQIFNHLAEKNRIVLILDGFDEIPTKLISNTIYQISQLHKVHDELKIIISSRPSQAVQNLSGFEIYALEELNESDYESFLGKLVPDVITRFNIYSAIIDAPPNIKGVITTPLMLTLLIQVYHVETEIPASLPDFYDKLFNAVFIKHDGIKPGFERERYSGLSATKLQKLFDAFCFMVLQSDAGRTLTNREFSESFHKAIKYTPASACELEGFKKDIITVACLMLNDGFEQTSFLHKSIIEYHAASFIQNSSDDFAAKFYQHAPMNYETWAETLTFLGYIDEFRYGNLYVLQEYPPALERLSLVLSQRTPESLISYLEFQLPNFNVVLEGTRPKVFTTDPFSRQHSFTNSILFAVVDNLHETLPQTSNINIQKAIRQTPKIERSVGINIKAMVTHIDQSVLWERLSEIERTLLSKVDKYKTIVSTEMKKHEIFS
ncbi:NACHT domain-containing protein [Pseudomonas carnis]|uniref:NACHT domain-containing protein n=1 Tax=Pseudomonas carnis TaxID=2487355 RepID=UPI0018D929CC|nr:NACHT domain-containing protein [Pseudomonas carnis]MBH3464820.1 NACHT domain-containing protein [Pseudomonas carnis]